MNITLNLSGQIFLVTPTTLSKIPYFKHMLETCDSNINETIFVERSPHIFKHVIAFIIDPLYPYPKKYAYELDFYDIAYNDRDLYDKNKEVIDIIRSEINDVKDKLCDKFQDKINDVKGKICDEFDNMREQIEARFENNLKLRSRDICLYKYEGGCDNLPDREDNYCLTHYSIGKYCDSGGCNNLRNVGRFCESHAH
jgi:hypothetical protein